MPIRSPSKGGGNSSEDAGGSGRFPRFYCRQDESESTKCARDLGGVSPHPSVIIRWTEWRHINLIRRGCVSISGWSQFCESAPNHRDGGYAAGEIRTRSERMVRSTNTKPRLGMWGSCFFRPGWRVSGGEFKLKRGSQIGIMIFVVQLNVYVLHQCSAGLGQGFLVYFYIFYVFVF